MLPLFALRTHASTPTAHTPDLRACWWLAVAMATAVVAYWPGLAGPFLYDDMPNLHPVLGWFGKQASWEQVVFGNTSGPLGRPVAMLTFLFSADAHWMESWGFKLDNLILHLTCAALAWRLTLALFRLDPRLQPHADWPALAVTTLWLLHPLHVSTVLYVVQRMAQLSSLFMLAALLVFVLSRTALSGGDLRRARIGLFVFFPLLWLLAVASKETAVVTSSIAFVLEVALFSNESRRPQEVRAFFAAFLVLPLLVGGMFLAQAGSSYLGSYEVRDFTLAQRLATQPHAVAQYIAQLALPDIRTMGLYTDDFPVARSLLTSPAATLSAVALLTTTAVSLALCKRAPLLLVGWAIFLLGLVVESSAIPLDIYYEHRTYLPALGLLIAIVGALAPWVRGHRSGPLGPATLLGVGAACVTLALLTNARALTWRSKESIAELGVSHHPSSIRAAMDLADIRSRAGQPESALNAIAPFLASPQPRQRLLARIATLIIRCNGGQPVQSGDFDALLSPAVTRLTTHEPQLLSTLGKKVIEGGCAGANADELALTVEQLIVAADDQADTAPPKLRLHLLIAQLYGKASQPAAALPHALKAWSGARGFESGLVLTHTYQALGMPLEAQRTLREAALYSDQKNSLQQRRMREALAPAPVTRTPKGHISSR